MQDDFVENRIYEIGYLIVPTASEEQVPKLVEKIHKIVEGASGKVISKGSPKLVDLAYPMSAVVSNKKHTYEQGYFGWVKFDADPALTIKLKDSLDKNYDVLRYIVIKTVAEDTMAVRKPSNNKVEYKKKTNKKEAPVKTDIPFEISKKNDSKKEEVGNKYKPEIDKKEKEETKNKKELSSKEIDETIEKLIID